MLTKQSVLWIVIKPVNLALHIFNSFAVLRVSERIPRKIKKKEKPNNLFKFKKCVKYAKSKDWCGHYIK